MSLYITGDAVNGKALRLWRTRTIVRGTGEVIGSFVRTNLSDPMPVPAVLEDRMRSSIAAIAIAGLASCMVSLAGPAFADWQYTQWGMSPDQVMAASGGVVRPNEDRKLDADGLTAKLKAPYEGAALPFTAVFMFDTGDRLTYVTLNPVGQISCQVIRTALAAHHGPPMGKADMDKAMTLRWDDVENDNLVVFLDLGSGNCSIQYSKLPNTTPSGDSL